MTVDGSPPVVDKPLCAAGGTGSVTGPDYQVLFELAPDPCLVLSPKLIILAVNDAYLDATLTKREEVAGCSIFEVFPRPAAESDTRVYHLKSSLDRVLGARVTDVMPVENYSLQSGDRCWRLSNIPVLGKDNDLAYILLQVNDLTELVHDREDSDGCAEITLLLQRANEQLAAQNEKLRESEQRFASFMINLPAVAWIKDINGRYIYVNPEAERFLPKPLEELTGNTDFDLFPADVARHIRETDQRVLAEGSIKTTEVLHQADGAERFAIVTKFPLPGPDGTQSIAGVGFDITERLKAEEALRASEELFHAIYNLAAVGIAQVTPEGELMLINHKLCDIIGYTIEELLTLTAFDISHPDDIEPHLVKLRQLLGGVVRDYTIEKRLVHKNGSFVWVHLTVTLVRDQSGQPEYLIAVVQDINERKRNERALRESEEKFSKIFNLAPIAISISTLEEGRIVEVNESLERMTGFRRDEVVGHLSSEFKVWKDPESRAQILKETIEHGEVRDREICLVDKAGRDFWGLLSAVVIELGGVKHLMTLLIDINEQKRAREALQQDKELLARRVAESTAELSKTIEKLQDEINERIRTTEALQEETAGRRQIQKELREKELMLLHQSRLAAMGEMIGNIAHQWRQPLNLLGLLAQELPMTYKRGEFTGEYLDQTVKNMLQAIAHMSQTINDFRGFFSPDKAKVDFHLVETIKKILSLLEGSLKKDGVEITVVASEDPVVNGHPNEFSQAVLNIISNARDAFTNTGTENRTITIEITVEDGRDVVIITDNAGGIPEDVIVKIFDPYFTTKGPEKGTGVGLYMSKTIIETNMGGILQVRNVAGGAQFRIII